MRWKRQSGTTWRNSKTYNKTMRHTHATHQLFSHSQQIAGARAGRIIQANRAERAAATTCLHDCFRTDLLDLMNGIAKSHKTKLHSMAAKVQRPTMRHGARADAHRMCKAREHANADPTSCPPERKAKTKPAQKPCKHIDHGHLRPNPPPRPAPGDGQAGTRIREGEGTGQEKAEKRTQTRSAADPLLYPQCGLQTRPGNRVAKHDEKCVPQLLGDMFFGSVFDIQKTGSKSEPADGTKQRTTPCSSPTAPGAPHQR